MQLLEEFTDHERITFNIKCGFIFEMLSLEINCFSEPKLCMTLKITTILEVHVTLLQSVAGGVKEIRFYFFPQAQGRVPSSRLNNGLQIIKLGCWENNTQNHKLALLFINQYQLLLFTECFAR